MFSEYKYGREREREGWRGMMFTEEQKGFNEQRMKQKGITFLKKNLRKNIGK